MKCPKCGGPIITFGNEWECVSCGNYGSFLDDKYDEDEKKKDSGKGKPISPLPLKKS